VQLLKERKMKRSGALLVAAVLCAVLFGSGIAVADPMGSVTGTVAAVSGSSIDVRSGRQIVHIVLPSPFFAVYLADKSRAALTDIAPGMTVRVTFTVSPTGLQTAREIDILGA
jgi:hypothetical protein